MIKLINNALPIINLSMLIFFIGSCGQVSENANEKNQATEKQELKKEISPKNDSVEELHGFRKANSTEVSESELKQFININQQIQNIQMQAEKQMKVLIDEEGLKFSRYIQIYQSEEKGVQDLSITEAELKKYHSANEKLTQHQSKAEEQIQKVYTSGDMNQKRYQEVALAIRINKELKNKLKALVDYKLE